MSQIVNGSFAGAGVSGPVKTTGQGQSLNLSLSGFGTATVRLERSFDDGASWKVVESYTADAEKAALEPEAGVSYRLNASAHTSGTIAYRLAAL